MWQWQYILIYCKVIHLLNHGSQPIRTSPSHFEWVAKGLQCYHLALIHDIPIVLYAFIMDSYVSFILSELFEDKAGLLKYSRLKFSLQLPKNHQVTVDT